MAEYMENLRAARRPPPSSHQRERRTSTLSIPGTFPQDDDSDWETTNSEAEVQAPRQLNSQPEIPPPPTVGAQDLSYQGVPLQNPIYATFQRGYAQAALGNGVGQYGVGNPYAGR